jgi:hypothetical protein
MSKCEHDRYQWEHCSRCGYAAGFLEGLAAQEARAQRVEAALRDMLASTDDLRMAACKGGELPWNDLRAQESQARAALSQPAPANYTGVIPNESCDPECVHCAAWRGK